MLARGTAALVLACLALGPIAGARGDSDADKAAIAKRLQDWASAFNARDTRRVCDLFSPDLISTVPDSQDAGKDVVCDRLRKLLTAGGPQLCYSPDIQEIIVSGDLAVVRLIWTLTARHDGETEISKESGLDIFRRQPDGTWTIIRFMALPISQAKELR
jgi:steroid delta-isomerase